MMCVEHIKEIVPGISYYSKKFFIFSISLLIDTLLSTEQSALFQGLLGVLFVIDELRKTKRHKSQTPLVLH